ncbi:hypothetical protein [Vibrio sp. 10N.222.55.B11]|uniref:hypothetical protein n=1 Tax=Vibrio sp. 10N.222.55.B11 TaxID=3229648 RepID=UPI00354B87CD
MSLEEYGKVLTNWVVEKTQALLAGETSKDNKTDYFPMLFDGYKEVFNSFEAMKFSLTLLESEFPISENIRKEKYLEYVIHAFYNDSYVLKELLKGYTNRIQKVYVKALPNEPIKSSLEPVFDALSNDIKPLMDIRNSHVHQERFQGGGISQLSELAFAAQFNDSFSKENEEAFQVMLSGWIGYFRVIIEVYSELLNECMENISEVVLENGVVREP